MKDKVWWVNIGRWNREALMKEANVRRQAIERQAKMVAGVEQHILETGGKRNAGFTL